MHRRTRPLQPAARPARRWPKLLVAALCLLTMLLTAAPAAAATRTFTGIGLTSDGKGYMLVSDRGEFYAFGTASPQNNPSQFSGSIVDVAVTADGRGAMAMSSQGQLYAFGTVVPQPNPTGFSGGMVAVAITADGRGTMAVSRDGQFYAYGTATAQPNPRGFSGGIVDLALTADGRGVMAVSGRGQFYAYGTARAQQNPSGFSGDITAVDITADGQGAVAVSGQGQLYAYGTANAQQNPSNFTGGIVGVDLTSDGRGLVAMSGSGQVYAYGTAVHNGNGDAGSASVSQLAQQILDSPNIALTGREVRNDMVLASQGKLSTANTMLTSRMLTVMLELAKTQKIVVTAIESRGTGHTAGSSHFKGLAADLAPGNGATYATIAKAIYANRSAWGIDELIHNPMPSGTVTLKRGSAFTYDKATMDAHKTHVHYSVKP